MSKLTLDNRMLEYDLNSSYSNIFCFSTTRHGGMSSGNYSSFNCNSYCGDKTEDVIGNRKILCKLLPQNPMRLVFPHQTHSTNVLSVDEAFMSMSDEEQIKNLEGVDALMTSIKKICLCISTADCIPVLLFDRRNMVVAAIHAGWRGTVNRIVRKTIESMIERYGSSTDDISACIGPGISVDSFEVGDEVYAEFEKSGFDMDSISLKNIETGKWHIDLPEANKLELEGCGVKRDDIELSGVCTFKNNDMFFSARRQGINSGRILSGIMMLDNDR